MLEHESTPALTNDHEIRVALPEFLAHLNEKWIWIGLHVV